MRVLLLNLNAGQFKNSGVVPSTLVQLGSMLGHQRAFGMQKVADVAIEEIDSLGAARKAVSKHDPAIVGITAYENTFRVVSAVCKYIKECAPQVQIVAGGPFATVLPETTLLRGNVDIVCRGEADFTFRELVQRIDRSDSVLGIKGVMLKDCDRRIQKVTESDDIPFVSADVLEKLQLDTGLLRSLFASGRYHDISISLSRGCPFRGCTFCFYDVRGNWRYITPEISIQKMELIEEFGDCIDIADAAFGGPRKLLQDMLSKFKGRFKNLMVNLTVDQLLTEGEIGSRNPDSDTINLLVEAGIRRLEVGVENFCDSMLMRLGKNRYSGEEAMKTVIALVQAGLHVTYNLIISDFQTSLSEVETTLQRADAIKSALAREHTGSLSLATQASAVPLVGTQYYWQVLNTAKKDGKDLFTGEGSLDVTYPLYFVDVKQLDPTVEALVSDIKRVYYGFNDRYGFVPYRQSF